MIDHVEIQSLLPWFVNGSLNEAEQSTVDQHVVECEECQSAVTQLVALSARFNAARPAPDAPDIDAFIDNLPPQSARQPPARTAAPWKRRWQLPALAACAVLALAVSLTTYLAPQDRYRTLGRTQVGLSGRTVIQVVFSPNAKEREIREILLQDDNQVISGPSRHGVYRVLLGPTVRSDIYVARLQHNPDVIFVEQEKAE